jgi:succinate-semialdehyde dehydrogenase/glutarate-semialdehyde dehydrogenase
VITIVNPATEEAIAEIPSAGVEETDAAVAAAEAAFPAWRLGCSVGSSPASAPAGGARRGKGRGAIAARDAERRQAIADARGEVGMVAERTRAASHSP